MDHKTSVLALFAHPDDAEFLCAGTLALFAGLGARVDIATLTAGDCGSTILDAARISRIRRREAAHAAGLIRAEYSCLNEKDLLIFYDRRTLAKVMEFIRSANPTLVFTHSPVDYMVDHETVSRLCQTACFGAMAPNFRTKARPTAKPLHGVPHLYYTQPFGGRDILGQPIRSRIYVNIQTTIAIKEQMLACHGSQRSFLRTQQGISDTVLRLKEMSADAGALSGFEQAEGFRQHLGQGFPQNDLLTELLGELVRGIES